MKLNVGEMHSDLDQSQREEIMHEFRNSRINILIATDIVAYTADEVLPTEEEMKAYAETLGVTDRF